MIGFKYIRNITSTFFYLSKRKYVGSEIAKHETLFIYWLA